MKVKHVVTTGILALSLVSPMIMADETPVTNEKNKEFEKIIHDYLVKNPEVLLEASQALQQKQQQNMQEQAKAAIKTHGDTLFKDNKTVAGNPKGDVSLVEFFDYQCGYCQRMHPIVSSLIEKDGNLRVVFKELPIFGESSELAARAALAAANQGKYKPMHDAIFKLAKNADEKAIMAAAQSIGLDVKKLKADMDSKQIKDLLRDNRKLAKQLKLIGTPAFIVAYTPKGQFVAGTEGQFIPGAASEEALQKLIKNAEPK